MAPPRGRVRVFRRRDAKDDSRDVWTCVIRRHPRVEQRVSTDGVHRSRVVRTMVQSRARGRRARARGDVRQTGGRRMGPRRRRRNRGAGIVGRGRFRIPRSLSFVGGRLDAPSRLRPRRAPRGGRRVRRAAPRHRARARDP